MAKVYEIMRKIKGRAQLKINILCEDGQYYSSIPDIVNRMVNTFSQISSNEQYPLGFQQLKNNCEQIALNFYSDNTEIYNSLFKMCELENALDMVHTSPGEDKINYQMIEKCNNDSKIYLLDIFNKFWIDSFFSVEWQHSIIIPIIKPRKDHNQSDNYRPIALTSCLCKLF